jgi:hypothetical protein
MTLKAVEGIYRDGTIELLEMPRDIQESRVLVTFLPLVGGATQTIMTLGMFAGSQKSTEADFMIAQFQGDHDDGLNW